MADIDVLEERLLLAALKEPRAGEFDGHTWAHFTAVGQLMARVEIEQALPPVAWAAGSPATTYWAIGKHPLYPPRDDQHVPSTVAVNEIGQWARALGLPREAAHLAAPGSLSYRGLWHGREIYLYAVIDAVAWHTPVERHSADAARAAYAAMRAARTPTVPCPACALSDREGRIETVSG